MAPFLITSNLAVYLVIEKGARELCVVKSVSTIAHCSLLQVSFSSTTHVPLDNNLFGLLTIKTYGAILISNNEDKQRLLNCYGML